jgi:hypothetical protein
MAPAPQRLQVVLRRIHVEKARAFGVEATNLLSVDRSSSNAVEQIYRPQLAARELPFEKRQDAAPIDGAQRLIAVLPMGYDDVPLWNLRDKV